MRISAILVRVLAATGAFAGQTSVTSRNYPTLAFKSHNPLLNRRSLRRGLRGGTPRMVMRFCAAICGAVILFAYPLSAVAKVPHGNVHSSANDGHSHVEKRTVGHYRRAFRGDGCATGQGGSHCASGRASAGDTIVGAASMYDPFGPGSEEGGLKTASGERYDPVAWTAAIKTGLRKRFGGIRAGKDYQPAYALIKVDNKQAIIKINDVGPLKPGRVIDFSKRTMRYFDPSLQLGVLQNVRITPLPGDGWSPGPING